MTNDCDIPFSIKCIEPIRLRLAGTAVPRSRRSCVGDCNFPVRPKPLPETSKAANVVYGELTVKSSQTSSALERAVDLKESFHTSNDPAGRLIERVISSNQFRSSLRLREFLLYIADCALKETPEAATEQQIGVHVFHRPPGYNSSEDSIVRTHARLLRQKLTEYFRDRRGGGAHDR